MAITSWSAKMIVDPSVVDSLLRSSLCYHTRPRPTFHSFEESNTIKRTNQLPQPSNPNHVSSSQTQNTTHVQLTKSRTSVSLPGLLLDPSLFFFFLVLHSRLSSKMSAFQLPTRPSTPAPRWSQPYYSSTSSEDEGSSSEDEALPTPSTSHSRVGIASARIVKGEAEEEDYSKWGNLGLARDWLGLSSQKKGENMKDEGEQHYYPTPRSTPPPTPFTHIVPPPPPSPSTTTSTPTFPAVGPSAVPGPSNPHSFSPSPPFAYSPPLPSSFPQSQPQRPTRDAEESSRGRSRWPRLLWASKVDGAALEVLQAYHERVLGAPLPVLKVRGDRDAEREAREWSRKMARAGL